MCECVQRLCDYVLSYKAIRQWRKLLFVASLISVFHFLFIFRYLFFFHRYRSPLFSVLFLLYPPVSSFSSPSLSVSYLAFLRRSPSPSSHIHWILHLDRHLLPDILFSGTFVRKSRVAPSQRTLRKRLEEHCLLRLSRSFGLFIHTPFFFSISLYPYLHLFFFTSSFHRYLPHPHYPTTSFFQDHHPCFVYHPFLVPIFFEARRASEPQTRLEWLWGDWSSGREMKLSK